MKLPWQQRSAIDVMALVWAFACLAVCSGFAAEPALLGNQSCATSTCHGGVIGSGPSWHFSLSTWMANDPHAGAGLVLRDADSRRIVTRLDPAAIDSMEAYDNVLRTRCISCHTTVASEQTEAVGRLDDTVLAAGVSCESCHGPAEKWITAHVQGNWQGAQRFAPETGMRDTESIIGRSETCVRCHIGSRTSDGMVRDMNHDLIAAGHPACDLTCCCLSRTCRVIGTCSRRRKPGSTNRQSAFVTSVGPSIFPLR